MAREPVEHVVKVQIKDGEFIYTGHMECLCVYPGDTIKWVLRNKLPYFVIIKALVSPLDISCKITGAGEETQSQGAIRAPLRGSTHTRSAPTTGRTLLIDDPEIIIRPPKGR